MNAFLLILAFAAAMFLLVRLLDRAAPPNPPRFVCDTQGCNDPIWRTGVRHTGQTRTYCRRCWEELHARGYISEPKP